MTRSIFRKRIARGLSIIIAAAVLSVTGCETDESGDSSALLLLLAGGSGGKTFDSASVPGDAVSVSTSSTSFKMIYANNQAGIIFPYEDDDEASTLDEDFFFMGQTEVTNKLVAEVFQWALDNGKLSTTVSDHNGVDSTTVKYGEQQLADIDFYSCRIEYSAGAFSVETGYDDHPIARVSWYGAIMFCNWLTEMKDGSTDNCVYSGIDTTLDYTEIVEDTSKTGYRLPSLKEWLFAARYIGQTAPTGGDLATEYVARDVNSGDSTLTDGYYWTPGDYASGALADHDDATETGAVAWYDANSGGDTHEVAGKTPNQLGIYDMSGNIWEYYFEIITGNARLRGGGYPHDENSVQIVDGTRSTSPGTGASADGFRLAKTQ
jgi:formylglycine-generating enzyme required for sulfatase activity